MRRVTLFNMIQAIALVIASTLAWSIFDVTRKKLVDRLPPLQVSLFLMIFQIVVFLLISLLRPRATEFQMSTAYLYPFLWSCILNAAGHVLFLMSVQRAPLSLAIPLLSLTPVFSSAAGWLYLSETLSSQQLLGIAVIVISALGFAWAGLRGDGRFDRPKVSKDGQATHSSQLDSSRANSSGALVSADSVRVRSGLLMMLVVTVLWALTPVVDKACISLNDIYIHSLLQSIGVGAILLVYLAATKQLAGITKSFQLGGVWAWSSGLLAALAIGLQMNAIVDLPVGIFEGSKRALGVVLALVLGRFFFQEAVTKMKVASAAVMIVGLILLLK
jgi:drug/metabolite transporter (DMT)-like permease